MIIFGLCSSARRASFVVIDELVFFAHAIRHHVVGFARKIELVPVRQVPAVGQVQPHDGIARRKHRSVRRLVGLRAGMRLHVGVFGAEELFGAVARQVFHNVGKFAAAVIALARIPLGVFVGEDAAGGFQHRLGREILAGDQLQLASLPLHFLLDRPEYLGIHLRQGPVHPFRCRHVHPP